MKVFVVNFVRLATRDVSCLAPMVSVSQGAEKSATDVRRNVFGSVPIRNALRNVMQPATEMFAKKNVKRSFRVVMHVLLCVVKYVSVESAQGIKQKQKIRH